MVLYYGSPKYVRSIQEILRFFFQKPIEVFKIFRDEPFNISGGYQKMTKNCFQEAKAEKNVCKQFVRQKICLDENFIESANFKCPPVAKIPFCCN